MPDNEPSAQPDPAVEPAAPAEPAPAVEPTEPQEPGAAQEPQVEPETWAAILGRAESAPWKSDYEAHMEAERQKVHTAAYTEVESLYSSRFKELDEKNQTALQFNKQANDSLKTLHGQIRRALSDNTVNPDLADALQETWGQLQGALQGIGKDAQETARKEGQVQGGWAMTEYVIAHAANVIGKPDLANPFKTRIHAGNETAAIIVKDFANELLEIGRKRGYEAGMKDAKGALAEVDKTGARAKGGPSTAQSKPGTRSEREVLADPNTSIEEIMKIRARQRAQG